MGPTEGIEDVSPAIRVVGIIASNAKIVTVVNVIILFKLKVFLFPDVCHCPLFYHPAFGVLDAAHYDKSFTVYFVNFSL